VEIVSNKYDDIATDYHENLNDNTQRFAANSNDTVTQSIDETDLNIDTTEEVISEYIVQSGDSLSRIAQENK
jgi:LysM repeat protein